MKELLKKSLMENENFLQCSQIKWDGITRPTYHFTFLLFHISKAQKAFASGSPTIASLASWSWTFFSQDFLMIFDHIADFGNAYCYQKKWLWVMVPSKKAAAFSEQLCTVLC